MSKKNNLADSGLKKLCSFLVLAASQGQLINDTLQAQDKVFSSKHVTDLINSMSEQDKKYVDDIVANLNKLSSKTTTVIPDSSNAEPNTLYLYSADPNPTSYNQYMVLSDKTILDLGTTNISLEGYLKETDADSKYLKQVDAHTHSNKTVLDAITQDKVDGWDKDCSVSVNGATYSNVDGLITLPNYPTPRTDDEIKEVAHTVPRKDAIDIIAYADSLIGKNNIDAIRVFNATNSPYGVDNANNDFFYTIYNITNDKFKRIVAYDIRTNNVYVRIKISGTWSDWEKLIKSDNVTDGVGDSSTDDAIPTAKAVNNKFNNMIIQDYLNSDTMNVNFNKTGIYKFNSPTKGAPENNVGDYMLLNIPWNNCYPRTGMYAYQLLFSPRCSGFWTRVVWNYNPDTYVYTEGDYSVFTKWKTVGYVQHAAKVIGFDSETNYKPTSITKLRYVITNNVCYVTGGVDCVTPLSELVVCTNMPEAYMETYAKGMNINGEEDTDPVKIYISGSTLQLRRGVAGNSYRFSFSYPLTKK